MTALQCPHCHVVLTDKDLDEGWCNECGKAIPQWEISAGLKERRQRRNRAPRSTTPPVAEPEPEPPLAD